LLSHLGHPLPAGRPPRPMTAHAAGSRLRRNSARLQAHRALMNRSARCAWALSAPITAGVRAARMGGAELERMARGLAPAGSGKDGLRRMRQ